MSESSTNGMNPLDPLGFWKTARDANLEAWSKMMVDVVNSDEYARMSGLALEQTLAASQPFKDALEKAMTQTLAMMNMPSRAEVISLAQRLVNVEMRLDDMDAKLNKIHKSLQETIKETIREASKTPDGHLKDVEADLGKMNAKLDALLKAVATRAQREKPPNTPSPWVAEKAALANAIQTTEKAQEGQ